MLKSDSDKIGWTVKEYLGAEIYKPPEGRGPSDQAELLEWTAEGNELKNREDLQPGDVILAPSLVGWYVATVKESSYGTLYAETESGNTMIVLDFDTDDRHCWITSGAANLKAIKRLAIETDEPEP